MTAIDSTGVKARDTRAPWFAGEWADRQAVNFRFFLALLVVVALSGSVWLLSTGPQAKLALPLIFGAIFGFVLQRSRFCFFCMFREWFEERDPRGLLGLVTALAVGIAGYTIIFGAWLVDPTGGRLPPDAFIGPISIVTLLAGVSFGAGMAISRSCISAHLYRLGEGSPTAPFALIGTVAGFVVGYLSWSTLYLGVVSSAQTVWLPRWLGYGGALAVSLLVLFGLALVLLRGLPRQTARDHVDPLRAIFVERWPALAGGLAVGALGTVTYFRTAPLGVTAELGMRARQLGDALSLLPSRLEGLDQLRGCITAVTNLALTPNGVFVLGLVAASLASALVAGQFKPAWPTFAQIVRGLTGGVLLGWGAMVGLGCTVGSFLSGIHAGSVSGWIFGASLFSAAAVVLLIERRFARAQ